MATVVYWLSYIASHNRDGEYGHRLRVGLNECERFHILEGYNHSNHICRTYSNCCMGLRYLKTSGGEYQGNSKFKRAGSGN